MNPVKEKLARGERVILVNPDFRAARLIEFIGDLGFDAVFVDCEYGNLSIDLVEEMARAARAAGIVSIVRPEENRRQLIIRYLECGVDGIMVPHVHTAEDARLVVEASGYRPSKDGRDRLILVMIESPLAIQNLAEIVKVEGIDVFFIGVGDIAAEMGLAGQHDHPKVAQLRHDAIKIIRAAGKYAGTNVTFENAHSMAAAGVQFLYIHGNRFFARGAAEFLAAVRAG